MGEPCGCRVSELTDSPARGSNQVSSGQLSMAAAAAVGAKTIAPAAAPTANRDVRDIGLIRIVDPLFMVEPLLGSHPGLPTIGSMSSTLVPKPRVPVPGVSTCPIAGSDHEIGCEIAHFDAAPGALIPVGCARLTFDSRRSRRVRCADGCGRRSTRLDGDDSNQIEFGTSLNRLPRCSPKLS
jgi:hypothetical protein